MSEFFCCRRQMQVTPFNCPCNKHLCTLPCQNGGVCWSSDKCACPKGFAGDYCQIDVDECVTEKPCDQICRNIVGSYECYCRSGYELQANRQSCRKNDSDGTAFEAKDLEEDFEESTSSSTRRSILRDTENEVDDREEDNKYKELLQRLIKLEKQLAKGKNREIETNEISSRIASAIDSINEIRRSIQNMQLMQQEIYELRNKVKLYEYETRKIQQLTSRVVDLEIRLMLHCRSNVFK
ncbi:PREDICTED: epidermal growth factor-like protein 8 [Ceratosolen solmsi marchali]|uniref:Epidermal growth factor-like protein 8 n=1 Tax=Ceratosolen solmsi marchali TaxID=326594 RepID=A0AAJ6YUA4_9HYME|nr:PREDICTED: epidermal growth factor-like protein 8 [Ceratosolen solmsi marchali]